MATREFSIRKDRLWADIMALAAITDPARPYTRRSFSPLFLQGRSCLAERFAEAGLSVRIDAAGNLIGRLAGLDPSLGVIAIGSHSDTVPDGGRFDGIAGLVAALEVVRAFHDEGVRPDHTLEVIDFLAEEPSEYGLSCVGSRGISGAIEPGMLNLLGPGGEHLAHAIARVGGDPGALTKRTDIAAFLELHIEQGPVLEQGALDVGIVSSIAGIQRIEIGFQGAADHAGTTPMPLRRDALVAAAATVLSVRRLAEQISGDVAEYFVATVGVLTVSPCASNVVPGECRLVIDARTSDAKRMSEFVNSVRSESTSNAAAAGVELRTFGILSDSPPVTCDMVVREALREGARMLNLKQTDLSSGAGHDTAFMARICPAGMLFVPCRGGRSHAPEEWAEPEQIAAGAAVLLHAVKLLDRSLLRTDLQNRSA